MNIIETRLSELKKTNYTLIHVASPIPQTTHNISKIAMAWKDEIRLQKWKKVVKLGLIGKTKRLKALLENSIQASQFK